jgi:tetratricopeptide (TPR) repeat protein
VSKAGLAKELAGEVPNPQRALLERMLADFEKAKTNADDKTAKKLSKKMDSMISDTWNTIYIAAVRQDSLGAFDKAVEHADIAILVMPADWRAYGLKAQMLDKLERPDEALPVWELANTNIAKSDWAQERPNEYKQALEIIRGRLLEATTVESIRKTIVFADELLNRSNNGARFSSRLLPWLKWRPTHPGARRGTLRKVAMMR